MNIEEMTVRELEMALYKKRVGQIKRLEDILKAIGKTKNSKVEKFGVVLLDGAHNVIKTKVVTTGLVNKTMAHPREIFCEAVKSMAVAVILFHNHPSGNLEPSPEDRTTTTRLIKAGEILGIQVLDHVIVSKTGMYSFLEDGILF